MEATPPNGAPAPVSRTRFDHCHISLYVGIGLAVVGAVAALWDWRAGGISARLVDWTLSGVLGGLTLLYGFLSLFGRTYEHSERAWYRNFTPEGRVAILLLVLTIAAGGTRTIVTDMHEDEERQLARRENDARLDELDIRDKQRADSTVAALRASEQRSRDTLRAKSDQIVGLVNSDVKAVARGLQTFLQANSDSLSEQERQQIYALMVQVSTADDSTTQRTARLRSYIEEYATRSTELDGRMLAALQALTSPADGVIPISTLRTAEARDSVVRTVDARFETLGSRFGETYGGISRSIEACKVNAEELGPQLSRFARLVDSLANLPAPSSSVQAVQTKPDSARAAEGR